MGVWLAVAFGGALGSVARHGVNHLTRVYLLTTPFPVALTYNKELAKYEKKPVISNWRNNAGVRTECYPADSK